MLQIPVNTVTPIYQTTITPAHEGFIVTVEEKLPQIPSVNINKIGNTITDAIRSATEIDEDSEIREIIRKNGLKVEFDNEDFPAEKILGAHIFTSYTDMLAFLGIIYAKNIEELKKRK